MKGPRRRFNDQFRHEAGTAFIRSKAQAIFRGEEWNLTLEEYFALWRDIDRWRQRGRTPDSLVMTRWDFELPWDKDNCCIITRQQQLVISVRRRYNRDTSDQYQGAIVYGH